MANSYHTALNKDYTLKIRALLTELPVLCGSFFRAIDSQTSVLTRYAYAIDLRGFFQFAAQQEDLFLGRDTPSLTAGETRRSREMRTSSSEGSAFRGISAFCGQPISRAVTG